jgi:hypothetical protein
VGEKRLVLVYCIREGSQTPTIPTTRLPSIVARPRRLRRTNAFGTSRSPAPRTRPALPRFLVSGQSRRSTCVSLSERLDVEPHSLNGIPSGSSLAPSTTLAAEPRHGDGVDRATVSRPKRAAHSERRRRNPPLNALCACAGRAADGRRGAYWSARPNRRSVARMSCHLGPSTNVDSVSGFPVPDQRSLGVWLPWVSGFLDQRSLGVWLPWVSGFLPDKSRWPARPRNELSATHRFDGGTVPRPCMPTPDSSHHCLYFAMNER